MKPIFSPLLRKWRAGIAKPYLKGDILDLGCGNDGYLLTLISTDQKYIGVDENPQIISRLKNLYPDKSFLLSNLDNQDLNIKEKFDTIVMLATIEHLGNPDKLFGTIKNFLKKDGKIILTTPTPFGNLIHKIGSRVNFFDIEAAKDHKIIYNRALFEELFAQHGFSMVLYRTFQLGCNQFCVAVPNK